MRKEVKFNWSENCEGEHELRVVGDDMLRAVLSQELDFWTDWICASGNPLSLVGDHEQRLAQARYIVESAITVSQGLGE